MQVGILPDGTSHDGCSRFCPAISQLVDAYIQCLTKERRLGQPADQNLKAKRQTASETLDKVVLDCRKRFSSFTPTDQNQYRKGVSSLINTVLPVWLKLRNTYINISK